MDTAILSREPRKIPSLTEQNEAQAKLDADLLSLDMVFGTIIAGRLPALLALDVEKFKIPTYPDIPSFHAARDANLSNIFNRSIELIVHADVGVDLLNIGLKAYYGTTKIKPEILTGVSKQYWDATQAHIKSLNHISLYFTERARNYSNSSDPEKIPASLKQQSAELAPLLPDPLSIPALRAMQLENRLAFTDALIRESAEFCTASRILVGYSRLHAKIGRPADMSKIFEDAWNLRLLSGQDADASRDRLQGISQQPKNIQRQRMN